jgi:hypothetical protein
MQYEISYIQVSLVITVKLKDQDDVRIAAMLLLLLKSALNNV